MQAPVIELKDVVFRWAAGAPCLDIPAMAVMRGETVLLRGPSGSGKSTLLALLGGVMTPVHGSLGVLGNDLSTLSPRLRDRFRADHIGMLFQQFNLITYLSVIENVLFPCRSSARRRACSKALISTGRCGNGRSRT